MVYLYFRLYFKCKKVHVTSKTNHAFSKLVPCDPQYQKADTRPVLGDKEHDDLNENYLSKSEDEIHQAIQEIQQSSANGLETFVDVRQLKSPSSPELNDCQDEHPFLSTKGGIIEGYRLEVVGGRKICAFEGKKN